jgi:hypothetical protein
MKQVNALENCCVMLMRCCWKEVFGGTGGTGGLWVDDLRLSVSDRTAKAAG